MGRQRVQRWLAGRGVTTIGVCFLHAYANPAHEEAMRRVLDEEHPAAVVSLSSQVLREYREYERAMTTLVDAAVKVRVGAYVSRLRKELDNFTGRAVPYNRDESNTGERACGNGSSSQRSAAIGRASSPISRSSSSTARRTSRTRA